MPATPPPPAAANASHIDGVAEHHLASVFELAPIGMSLVSPRHQRLRVNRAFCQMLGYTEPELMALPVDRVMHPEDVPGVLRECADLLAGGRQEEARELRYLHRDGHLVWARVTCTLARSAAGEPLFFIIQVQDITQSRQAELALRESEERFRNLCKLSADWYWEQDAELRFISFTGEARLDAWGGDQPGLIGLRRWEIPGLVPLSCSWEQHRATLDARRPFRDFEYMRVLPDRPVSWITASGEPMHDANGRFLGYRGIARDITAGKLAEQRLQDTQALLHMAAQIGRLGAWSWEVGDPRLFWSEEVCAIHEVRSGFMPTPEQFHAFVAQPYRDAMRLTLDACLRDGSPFDVELQVVTRKNRLLWVRMIGEAEWDAQGRVRRIQGACQDISETKRAAEESRRTAEQLSATLESLTDAFLTVDREGRFTYVNGHAEQLLQRSRTLLLGTRLWDQFKELRGTPFEAHYQRALADNVTVQFEDEYVRTGMWVQVKIYPSPQGLAVYVRDVTERIQAQREVLRLNAELEERVRQRTAQFEAANKELEAFSYSIAHDLRAPLSSIDGFSQMLAQSAGEQLPERSRHYLSRIRAGVRQMSELTDGLLALANFSRSHLRWEPVDLALLARTSIAALREREPQREVEVSVPAHLPVWGDPRMLSQVVGNLVGNAWKFTGRVEAARIEIGCQAGPDGATVYFVKDNGAGFDMAHASRMFEAFQRMHGASDFEGTGIGLAIVHRIVTRHGGSIWAESAPGRGATFYFTLADAPA